MTNQSQVLLPPEWARQSAVMLTWPHRHGDWADSLEKVERVYLQMPAVICARQDLLVVAYDEEHAKYLGEKMTGAGIDQSRLHLAVATNDDSWARDHGPITVLVDGKPLLLDFVFNGWGGKFSAEQDTRINKRLFHAGVFNCDLRSIELVLEGGSIESDGMGTLMTTRKCLLNPNRNPGLGLEQIEGQLKDLLGVERILWLDHGELAGDDTDAHIDTLARFADARTITYVRCDDPDDAHYAELQAMERELQQFTTFDGQPYNLVPLPWPTASFDEDGRRLPATYANYLIINDAVLVPTYDDPKDSEALSILAGCFPGREIIGINCRPIIEQNGSLHCLTMQLPAGVIGSEPAPATTPTSETSGRKSRTLKVGLVQQRCSADRLKNIEASMAGIRKAAAQGAKLVLLQELHTSLYFCQTEDVDHFDLAETIPGPSTDAFSKLARELDVVIVTSLFERRAAGLYHNTAVVIERDGSIAGKYRKMHIPDDPGFYEKFYFTPGDLGFTPIQTSVGRLGVLVCWDQWYPEAARLMALAGADLLIYPTAIGWDPRDDESEKKRQREAWITIQRAHAVANGVPVIAINRIGHEADPSSQSQGIQFWGSSFVAGPQGEILAEAGHEGEQVLVCEIDLGRGEDVRRIWPYLRDRRIDAYDDIVRRYLD